MSVTVQRNIWEHSPAKGNTLLVELALGKHVIEKRVEAGLPAEAWPSQSTLAKMCRCSRSTVERALEDLKRLGRISDTGRREYRQYRGTVIYEFSMTHAGSPELTDSESAPRELTDSEQELTHSGPDLTHSAPSPASPMTHKQGSKQVVKKVDEQGPASPSARPDISLSDQKSTENSNSPFLTSKQALHRQAERDANLADLLTLRQQLPTSRHAEQTQRSIEALERELGLVSDDPEVTAHLATWSGRAAEHLAVAA